MRPLRRAIAGEVHRLFASPGAQAEAAEAPRPRLDGGYFRPQSVAWRVHGELTTMLAGGISALLLQMLHPKALAGVWDHSDFRSDMSGRLRRTAQFLSGTTYGSRVEADALIARVRGIHDRVHGVLPDGTPYSANDPELLTFVHIAGTWSFLNSWQRYRAPLPWAERDAYYSETALVARMLGAEHVPESEAEVEAYFRAIRPELKADARTAEVRDALLGAPAPSLALEPMRRLVMGAGAALLPPWAARLHGLPVSRAGAMPGFVLDGSVKALGRLTAWALKR